ncbi:MAG: histone deacetylase family protein, partial [Methanotrichaceae archaeon]|nr:histone deacetylase family protein [Methanotrichaceae archaeon]
MRIVYSDRYGERYPSNPVEHPGRVIQAAKELAGYEFQEPSPASKTDILRVHSPEHLERVAMRGMLPAASLAAGGAIAAAELALHEVPAFALIRPPGHHASSSTSWGMCFLNNMAIA